MALPAKHRLRARAAITDTIRQGRRAAGPAGHPTVVVHMQVDPRNATPPQAAFAVARSVGGAVVRNRVRRRLQHVTAPRLGSLPSGTRLVIRALPASAQATTDELARGLDEALARAGRPALAGRAPTGRAPKGK